MGFDLKPHNSALEWFHFGAFSWLWMLDSGVGLVLSTGSGRKPASFFYQEDEQGFCPHYNDGFRVPAKEARMMAQIARGLVFVQHGINDEWEALSKEERTRDMAVNEGEFKNLYRTPVREDFLDRVSAFADWADRSKGFRIL